MKDEQLLSALKELNKILKGLNWIVLSGLAVKIYANPKREVKDIDIVIPNRKEFLEASERLEKEVKRRFLEKENFTAKDDGFEFSIKGVEVEITAGMWEMKFGNLISKPKLDKEWVEHVRKREFLGLRLNVQPLEDLFVQKIAMNREKDKKDLEYLLTKLNEVDTNFLKKDAESWNCSEKIFSYLKAK